MALGNYTHKRKKQFVNIKAVKAKSNGIDP